MKTFTHDQIHGWTKSSWVTEVNWVSAGVGWCPLGVNWGRLRVLWGVNCGGFGHIFGSPQNQPEALVPSQTKAGSGSNIIETEVGGGGVDTPNHASGWLAPPTDPRPTPNQPPTNGQPIANQPNQKPTDSVHMVSPYFEGAESRSGLGLPRFLGFGSVSRANTCGPKPYLNQPQTDPNTTATSPTKSTHSGKYTPQG